MNKVKLYILNIWTAIKNDHSFTKQLLDTIDYLTEELQKVESKLIKQNKTCKCSPSKSAKGNKK